MRASVSKDNSSSTHSSVANLSLSGGSNFFGREESSENSFFTPFTSGSSGLGGLVDGGSPPPSTPKQISQADLTAIQRQGGPDPVTGTFRNCSARTSGIADSAAVLDAAMGIARNAVSGAISALSAAPVAGSLYETALQRHFMASSESDRAGIAAKFRRILGDLSTRRNFVCDPNCTSQAEWDPNDDLIHLCPRFFAMAGDPECQAIVLIHEAAHDSGIDGLGTHGANRGTPRYPLGAVPLPPNSEQSTARRRNNADSYAFFAMHLLLGNDLDRTCFP